MGSLSGVQALFVGGPHDGQQMTVPGDVHGRPTVDRIRLPLERGPLSLQDYQTVPSPYLSPMAAIYEAAFAVSDHDHLWRYRYVHQS